MTKSLYQLTKNEAVYYCYQTDKYVYNFVPGYEVGDLLSIKGARDFYMHNAYIPANSTILLKGIYSMPGDIYVQLNYEYIGYPLPKIATKDSYQLQVTTFTDLISPFDKDKHMKSIGLSMYYVPPTQSNSISPEKRKIAASLVNHISYALSYMFVNLDETKHTEEVKKISEDHQYDSAMTKDYSLF
jgi:hypothetical protein